MEKGGGHTGVDGYGLGLRAVTVDYGIRLSRYGYSTRTVKPSGCQEYGHKFTVAKRVV